MKCNSAFALLVCFVAVLAHPASAATSSVGAPPGAMPGTPPITGLVTDEFAITAGEAGATYRIPEPPWLPRPGETPPKWRFCALSEYHMGGRESSGQCRVYQDSMGWVLTGYVGRGMGGPVTCRARCQYLR